LSRYPQTGSSRYGHELDLPGLRMWPLKTYPFLIFYLEQPDHLDIWRVLHSQRDIPAGLCA
jgi:toxin ParE1/3/4